MQQTPLTAKALADFGFICIRCTPRMEYIWRLTTPYFDLDLLQARGQDLWEYYGSGYAHAIKSVEQLQALYFGMDGTLLEGRSLEVFITPDQNKES